MAQRLSRNTPGTTRRWRLRTAPCQRICGNPRPETLGYTGSRGQWLTRAGFQAVLIRPSTIARATRARFVCTGSGAACFFPGVPTGPAKRVPHDRSLRSCPLCSTSTAVARPGKRSSAASYFGCWGVSISLGWLCAQRQVNPRLDTHSENQDENHWWTISLANVSA